MARPFGARSGLARDAGAVSVATLVLAVCGGGPQSPAPEGSVRVSVATTGADIDPDGYTLFVGDSVRAVDVNAEVTVDGLPEGAITVALVGIAPNCEVDGPNGRSVTVSAGTTTGTTFPVRCAPLSWRAVTGLPTPRLGLATAVMGGKLYAIGGYAEANDPGRTVVEAYDPASDAWVARSPMPTPRLAVAAATLGGVIYAVGGTPDNATVVGKVEAYDPVTDAWTAKADMPTARALVALEAVGGRLYAIGGGPDPATGTTAVEIYDPATDSWTSGRGHADAPVGPLQRGRERQDLRDRRCERRRGEWRGVRDGRGIRPGRGPVDAAATDADGALRPFLFGAERRDLRRGGRTEAAAAARGYPDGGTVRSRR